MSALDDLLPKAADCMQKIAEVEAKKASDYMRKMAAEDAEKSALLEKRAQPSGVSDEERMKRGRQLSVEL